MWSNAKKQQQVHESPLASSNVAAAAATAAAATAAAATAAAAITAAAGKGAAGESALCFVDAENGRRCLPTDASLMALHLHRPAHA